MKNGILIWNVVLTLLVGYLAFTHFGSRKKSAGKTEAAETLPSDKQFRMAYFEMDSVAANFELVKQLKADLTKKEEEINSEMTRRAREFEQKFEFYSKKAEAGTLTQEQQVNASAEMKKEDENNKLRKQQLDQEYNTLMVNRQNEIKSKIELFIKEYNSDKRYSYIVSYEPGLFYYQDTAYNITRDVIKGLNEKFKPAKGK